ncbi:hypothetical protein DYB26_006266 [Aphanomyces astaci]|uniref:AP-3 complex subunit delta n=1 Tax=Aphanomyces astaci TaxID=112090 RepID=A0A3R6XGB3_APHAT|nr:hypothetical protein DYB26_006266 [Aphanomyces astaci]
MRHVAAFLLLVLGGNTTPSAADVEKVITSVGGEVDSEQLEALLKEVEGKDIYEVIAAGQAKLATVSVGGGASAGAAAASSGGAAAPVKEEKEEEEEADLGGGMDMFGGSMGLLFLHLMEWIALCKRELIDCPARLEPAIALAIHPNLTAASAMFEKTLADLVKGIRSCKGDVSVYISQSMQEIKTELKSTDPFIKSQAIRKLTYLNMQGYDMSWAAFHTVEVMSYERFAHKRIGYLAASQSFTQNTDVVLLCTNLFKKEFGSVNEYEVGLALNAMANICTLDLARDLLGDILNLMNSHKPYVRKKATLILYKLFLRYPQGLRLSFDRLKERMEEPDVSVVSCSVNVICELANKKPKNYVGLAPQFFRLLTTSSNNWMLIKVVKLMSSLVPEEPRLARKLLDPLATIIQNTPAKSLLYECISTVTTALLYTQKSDGTQPRNVPAIVKLCNDHLRRYIEDPDQNLRYLGLVGLSNLMHSHPHVISDHQHVILECLSVEDTTIRLRALELLVGMVNPDNASGIIEELMRHTVVADGVYRQDLMAKILLVCSVQKYQNVSDFDWYLGILVQLATVPGENAKNAAEITRQLVDLAVRVKGIRAMLVQKMIEFLLDEDAVTGPGAKTTCQVLYAAGWIIGEFILEYVEDEDDDDDDDGRLDDVMNAADHMLLPRTTSLPVAPVQAVYMQALLKLLMVMVDKADEATVDSLAQMIVERLPAFVQSEHIEVQERACGVQEIVLGLGLGLNALSADDRANRVFDSQPLRFETLFETF